MRDLPIELLGSAFLRQSAVGVVDFNDTLRDLVRTMYRTMYRANGQGLAAPQVGVLQRIVVIDLPDEDSPALTIISTACCISIGCRRCNANWYFAATTSSRGRTARK